MCSSAKRLTTNLTMAAIAWTAFCFSAILPCAASNPSLVRVLPRGVQRGTQTTLVFHGARIGDAEEVFFYDDGFQVKKLTVINSKKVKALVTVKPDCRLGEHIVQLRTRSGISDYRIIYVEAYPEVRETDKKEAKHKTGRQSPQLIQPVAYSTTFPKAVGVVIAGRIQDEDHDWFAVDGAQGDRLSIEVVGMRLGDYCDTVLELIGPKGKTIATVDDTPLTKQDPFLSIQLPSDGRYLIHLSDAEGRGGNNYHYRMHVGNFPRPGLAVPAVAPPDQITAISFQGDCFGPIERELKLSNKDVAHGGVLVSDQRGITPTPVPFLLSNATQFMEDEPNDSPEQATEAYALPFHVSGCIDRPDDRDLFAIQATKGQRIRIETFGHRIGSTIDTSIQLKTVTNRSIGYDANSRGTDSMLDLTIPKDGRYFVEVVDSLSNFGPSSRYQLEVSIAEPALSIGTPKFERYTQQRQQIAVHANNRFAMLLSVNRQDVDGMVKLIEPNLPAGIRMIARPVPADSNKMPVVFESIVSKPTMPKPDELISADSNNTDLNNAESSTTEPVATQSTEATRPSEALEPPLTEGRLIELTAELIPDTADPNTPKVIGSFQNKAEMMRVQPNNMCMKFAQVDRLAAAVLEPAPFRIQLVPPATPITQSGRAKLTIKVNRDEGFTSPLTLRLPFRPPGVAARSTLQVQPNQTSIDYPINANKKATLGTWPICVTATSKNKNGMMVSTGLHNLEVIEPFVSCQSELVSCEAGAKATFQCELETLHEFAGPASARLRGVPHQVSATESTFVSGDKTIEFTLTSEPDCKTGTNHTAIVEVTIQQAGHPIVFDAGRIKLRFARPAAKPLISATERPAVSETTWSVAAHDQIIAMEARP